MVKIFLLRVRLRVGQILEAEKNISNNHKFFLAYPHREMSCFSCRNKNKNPIPSFVGKKKRMLRKLRQRFVEKEI